MVFIGVSNNDTVEDGMNYRDQYGVTYSLSNAPEVWELYGDPYRPTTVVIGADGAETARIDGPITVEGLSAELDRALART